MQYIHWLPDRQSQYHETAQIHQMPALQDHSVHGMDKHVIIPVFYGTFMRYPIDIPFCRILINIKVPVSSDI